MLLKSKELSRFNHPAITKAGGPIRVLIIFPPSHRSVRAMWTIHNETENSSIGAKPPLGPMFIAAYMKKHTPHDVRLLDCQVLNMKDDGIREEIKKFRPDLVGVCAWTDFWYDAWRCVQITKEVDPNIHVTVGGPHVGIYPDVTLENSGCDSVIVGDGEIPFTWLANGLSNGEIPDNLPGLHIKKGSGVKPADDLFYIHGDLDSLPFPIRTMLPYKKYSSVIDKGDFVTTMITSRGCPYKCTFCKLSFQKTLSRSAENIVDEMQEISDLGIREIQVYDDTFTWSKKRLVDICKGIIDRGLKLDWAIRDRVSSATPETMEWLAKAGCTRVHFGIESGSNKTLNTIKKSITVEQTLNAVKIAKENGLQVLGYFMIGLPGETVDDMKDTFRLANRLDLDYVTYSVTVPYAGTEMYEEGLKTGIIPVDYWREYAKQPTPNYVVPYFWEEYLNKEQLLKMRDEGTRKFYFRPKYIFREIRKISGVKELVRKARMALNVFQTSVLGEGEDIYLQSTAAEMGAGRLGVSGGYANNAANPVSVRS
ncbi:B12-binding domain-containing radical SAM protein [bacterium]|nr:B12-binding domain-containing radical SAM protein [bacterium]